MSSSDVIKYNPVALYHAVNKTIDNENVSRCNRESSEFSLKRTMLYASEGLTRVNSSVSIYKTDNVCHIFLNCDYGLWLEQDLGFVRSKFDEYY